ncbi:PhnE/PtxC family ABC transporter permease [Treponema pedis]|uniref:Phosphonate ABC transporter permease n=2 Tax=Treponema pedis TaxID=409322 RepID=S5ZN28_9SPIR|nr:ABC transporter permease subunit [Treponema pedis]AGT43997.1 phosphonate ABC transporter permease [Treponema pedis str. T A4]QOW61842.1 ABC transporter permease subunit [Treponema pedis]
MKGRTAVRKFSKERFLVKTVLCLLTVITVTTLIKMEIPAEGIKKSFEYFFNYAGKMFFHAGLSNSYSASELFSSLFVSAALALLTTLIGVIFALILGIASSENLSHKAVVKCIRGLMSFVRAVPTIIWVLVFSVVAGLGAEAAILGMSFHSTAYLVKGFSESFEQIDKKTVEALRACGAGYIEIITQAVLPSSVTSLISWSFFRFEINFGNAVAVGAAAGAGGIGYELFMAGNLKFNLGEVGFISYMIFVTAIILELCSVYIKKKLKQ